MTKRDPFWYFKTSPEVIRPAVMLYVRFPLSLRNVEDLLHERGIDVSHEAIQFWWHRFCLKLTREERLRSELKWLQIETWAAANFCRVRIRRPAPPRWRVARPLRGVKLRRPAHSETGSHSSASTRRLTASLPPARSGACAERRLPRRRLVPPRRPALRLHVGADSGRARTAKRFVSGIRGLRHFDHAADRAGRAGDRTRRPLGGLRRAQGQLRRRR